MRLYSPNRLKTNFQANVKQCAKVQFSILQTQSVYIGDGTMNDPELNASKYSPSLITINSSMNTIFVLLSFRT
jgi:hypothetical protein